MPNAVSEFWVILPRANLVPFQHTSRRFQGSLRENATHLVIKNNCVPLVNLLSSSISPEVAIRQLRSRSWPRCCPKNTQPSYQQINYWVLLHFVGVFLFKWNSFSSGYSACSVGLHVFCITSWDAARPIKSLNFQWALHLKSNTHTQGRNKTRDKQKSTK